MHAHSFVPAARPPRRIVRRNGLLQLGWPHFWLLAGTLGGLLALVALIYFIAYFPAGLA
jgi:hypothetical protein